MRERGKTRPLDGGRDCKIKKLLAFYETYPFSFVPSRVLSLSGLSFFLPRFFFRLLLLPLWLGQALCLRRCFVPLTGPGGE